MLPHVTFILAIGKVAYVAEQGVADGVKRIVTLFGENVPENVVVARAVDQPKVLQRANGFLTHCGQNSCNEAILAAVPVITAPFFGDQIGNALRFDELGCGFAQSFHPDLTSVPDLAKGWAPDLSLVTPASLAASIHRLLAEPQFQEAMVALRARQEDELGVSLIGKLRSMIANVDQQAKHMSPSFSNWATVNKLSIAGA